MISREEVEALAKLARLELGGSDIEKLQGDISGILDYVGQINSMQADAKTPEAPALRNALREGDAPREASDILAGKESALRAAFPKEENGYNVVRKIIQKDE